MQVALIRRTGEVPAKRASAAWGPAVSAARWAAAHVGAIPRRSAATTGRGMQLFAAVLRHSVTDGISLRLPVGELLRAGMDIAQSDSDSRAADGDPVRRNGNGRDIGPGQSGGRKLPAWCRGWRGCRSQGAPITAGLLMGGAAASAIASDFGARSIREELEAMRVMGVDPVRRLVVPRFLALHLIAPMLCIFIIVAGTAAAFVMAVTASGVPTGEFLAVVWDLCESGGRMVRHRQDHRFCRDCRDSLLASRNGGKGRSTRCRRRGEFIGSTQCHWRCLREPGDNAIPDDVLSHGGGVVIAGQPSAAPSVLFS